QFGRPPIDPCKFCGASHHAAVYYEHGMQLTGRYPISGHPDMFLRKSNVVRVVELKSISGLEFPKLVAPLAEHVCQISTYMWGIPQDKTFPIEIDADTGYLVYISKGYHQKELPVKMFPVKKNDTFIRQLKKKLAAYKKGYANFPKDVPKPIDICMKANFTGWRAKQCPAKNHCLALLEKEG
ncbi:unnamed protein product, partial [marine sediment metagenome]